MKSKLEKSQDRLRESLQYQRYPRLSFWGIVSPVAAYLLAAPLQHQFQIPQSFTYAVGFGVWAVHLFLYRRKVWRQAAEDKKELQRRADAADTALFGEAKNCK